jgi:putative ABC transport system permease protein
MRLSRVVWKELWHRKVGALIILLGITLCVALIVALRRVSLSAIDEMRQAMLEMGKNIVILPQGLALEQYWASDFGDKTLPQEDVQTLADYCIHRSRPKILARHFLGSLQRRIEVEGQPVILSGITVEIDVDAPKAVTAGARRALKPDEAELGARAARRLGRKTGDILSIGRPPKAGSFKVIQVHRETGTMEDFKVFVDLGVAQEMLGTGPVVNVIEAVSCLCAPQSLPALSKKIERQLFRAQGGQPRATAYHFQAIAEARFAARQGVMRDANRVSAVALVFGLLVVGAYSVMNARERRREMGIVLAVAGRPRHVAWLVLHKMLLLGLAGGVLGCLLGEWLAQHYGLSIATALHPSMQQYLFSVVGWQMYGLAVGLAVVLTLLPSLVGVLIASATDPAETLREL